MYSMHIHLQDNTTPLIASSHNCHQDVHEVQTSSGAGADVNIVKSDVSDTIVEAYL